MANWEWDEISLADANAHSCHLESESIASAQLNHFHTTTSTTTSVATSLITNALTPVESDSPILRWLRRRRRGSQVAALSAWLQPECDRG